MSFKTSVQVAEETGLSLITVNVRAPKIGVAKFGSSYCWTEEDIQKLLDRKGKRGCSLSEYTRVLFRKCSECPHLQELDGKRVCIYDNRNKLVNKNIKTSPHDCPLGYTIRTQDEEHN